MPRKYMYSRHVTIVVVACVCTCIYWSVWFPVYETAFLALIGQFLSAVQSTGLPLPVMNYCLDHFLIGDLYSFVLCCPVDFHAIPAVVPTCCEKTCYIYSVWGPSLSFTVWEEPHNVTMEAILCDISSLVTAFLPKATLPLIWLRGAN